MVSRGWCSQCDKLSLTGVLTPHLWLRHSDRCSSAAVTSSLWPASHLRTYHADHLTNTSGHSEKSFVEDKYLGGLYLYSCLHLKFWISNKYIRYNDDPWYNSNSLQNIHSWWSRSAGWYKASPRYTAAASVSGSVTYPCNLISPAVTSSWQHHHTPSLQRYYLPSHHHDNITHPHSRDPPGSTDIDSLGVGSWEAPEPSCGDKVLKILLITMTTRFWAPA